MKEKNKILSKHLKGETIYSQAIRYAVYDAMDEYAKEVAIEAVKLARQGYLETDSLVKYTKQEILDKLNLNKLTR